MSFREKMAEYFQSKGVYVIKKEDHNRYLEIFSKSFFDYELIHFFMDKVEKIKVEKFFDVSIKAMGNNCITIADSNKINGVLCVYDIRQTPGILELLKSGGYSFFPMFGIKKIFKMIKVFTCMDKIMNKYRKENDFYLYYLATIPEMQKRGIAKNLMNTLFEYCDENHCGVYLETYDENDSKYYQKLGYEEKEVVKLDDDLTLYAMYYPAK